MGESINDTLIWIEQHLTERFELLLRTNREYDRRSGVHGGMWYLHLSLIHISKNHMINC